MFPSASLMSSGRLGAAWRGSTVMQSVAGAVSSRMASTACKKTSPDASRPASSRPASSAAKRMQKFRVFRYDPESGVQPKMQEFSLDLNETGPMILDAVIKIKSEQDSTLAFRRSCREGVCGSCAMNVSGINQLACTSYIEPSEEAIEIQPLPSLYVIRDLVADLNNFYKQYAEVRPWLQRKTPKVVGQKENYQSQDDRAKLDGLYECILCACCSTSCPSFWWNPEQYLGPAALLQSYRWIIDSRDEYQDERLSAVNDSMKLYRCHGILNCVDACPKGLNPAKAIQGIKDLVEEKYSEDWETLKAQQVRQRGDEAMAAEKAEREL